MSWADHEALSIYHRAFDLADLELDPDPDRDYYNPELTSTGTTRPFRLPPVPDPLPRAPDPALLTGRAIRTAHQERDELRAALLVALDQRDAARDDLDRSDWWRTAWFVAAFVLGLLLTYSWMLDGRGVTP